MRQIQAPLFQRGLLQDHAKCARFLSPLAERFFLITDETVNQLHAKQLFNGLKSQGLPVTPLSIPAGEASKTRAMKEKIEDALFAANALRYSMLIAMGGGVITDLVGFVASTYCRGTRLCLIPTTLLGMCDAALGGKTGVNVPEGKNRIGTFYPADLIWIDPEALSTLPKKHLQEGLVEMIKHALIADVEAFAFLEQHLEQILTLDPFYLDEAIKQSCAIKQKIVLEDPEEKGLRAALNFGHTVGHAMEEESHYTISHGQAVVQGLKVEARLSREYAGLPKNHVERIDQLIDRLGITTQHVDSKQIMPAMQRDKKNRQGHVHFVLLEAIGKIKHRPPFFTHALSLEQIEKGFK